MKLLAIYQNEAEQELLSQLSEAFREFYHIDSYLISDYTDELGNAYQGILAWCDLDSKRPLLNLSSLNLFEDQAEERIQLRLLQCLLRFERSMETNVLRCFPYYAGLTDEQGQVISSNQKPIDLYDDIDTDRTIPKWVLENLATSPDHSFHTHIPSMSFERILIHSYYLQKDSAHPNILQVVQDIKPLLSHYLEETGQTLVGWSDVTSGASIQSDDWHF